MKPTWCKRGFVFRPHRYVERTMTVQISTTSAGGDDAGRFPACIVAGLAIDDRQQASATGKYIGSFRGYWMVRVENKLSTCMHKCCSFLNSFKQITTHTHMFEF